MATATLKPTPNNLKQRLAALGLEFAKADDGTEFVIRGVEVEFVRRTEPDDWLEQWIAKQEAGSSVVAESPTRYADIKARLAALNCELLEDDTDGGASYYVLDKAKGKLVSVGATLDYTYEWVEETEKERAAEVELVEAGTAGDDEAEKPVDPEFALRSFLEDEFFPNVIAIADALSDDGTTVAPKSSRQLAHMVFLQTLRAREIYDAWDAARIRGKAAPGGAA